MSEEKITDYLDSIHFVSVTQKQVHSAQPRLFFLNRFNLTLFMFLKKGQLELNPWPFRNCNHVSWANKNQMKIPSQSVRGVRLGAVDFFRATLLFLRALWQDTEVWTQGCRVRSYLCALQSSDYVWEVSHANTQYKIPIIEN